MKLRYLLCLVVPRVLAAQYLGVSAGQLSSTVDWQYPAPPPDCGFCVVDAMPNGSRSALAPAVVVQWRAASWLGVGSEVRFTPKGFATTQPTLEVSYLEVPVLLRVGKLVRAESPVAAFAEVGPAVALRVQCHVLYNGISDGCRNGAAFGQDWRIRSTDLSGIAGLGAAFRVGEQVIVAGARIDWGLVDIGGGQGVPTKNRSAMAYLGWLRPLGSGSPTPP